ncbi:MAG: hypothetical protein ABS948_05180 [Solibacillus sp.]
MAERTISEIKKIEEEIYLALQILRNEIETLAIIKDQIVSSDFNKETHIIIQDELAESFTSIEQLIDLHKNLETHMDKLEVLVQDFMSTKV